jgi:hypothetical protein
LNSMDVEGIDENVIEEGGMPRVARMAGMGE